LSLDSLDRVLAAYSQEEIREAYLINEERKVLASSRLPGSPQTDAYLAHDSAAKLYDQPGEAVRYVAYNGLAVIGTLKRAPVLGWGVVAEINKDKAFAKIEALQRMTLLLVGILLVGIGLCAYVLGLTIVRPLRRLTRGADQVAAGNLDIDLPVSTHSEVGYLTQVFNHMVARLRRSREELASVNAELQAKNHELHALSITDELTGLYNRKHLMETLQTEVIRSQRNRHAFALLVVDIDHFKMVNDTYGHQKGDDVLRRLGVMLRGAVRSCDHVARYGPDKGPIRLVPKEKRPSTL
jgi:HAMP domain-containing protein